MTLTRRVGVRALRRLSRRSAQGGCSYGAKGSEGLAAKEYNESIDKVEASVQAVSEAMRQRKIHMRCLMASATAGVGLGLLLAFTDDVPENEVTTA